MRATADGRSTSVVHNIYSTQKYEATFHGNKPIDLNIGQAFIVLIRIDNRNHCLRENSPIAKRLP